MRYVTVSVCMIFAVLLGSSRFSFALPPCPGTYNEKIWTDCTGTYTHANGDTYVGEFSKNKIHGKGTYRYTNGDVYVGGHKENKKHGNGVYSYANGDKYVGEFKDDKANGKGIYTYANGDRYVGVYKDGKAYGRGTYTLPNGDKYVGEHKDGKADGRGTYTYANGNKYVGEWKNDKLHGHGTFSYANGDKYVGEWKDDKFHGWGSSIHGPLSKSAGDTYEGEFRNNERNGQGTYIYASGSKYVGEHRHNKKHGKGTYSYANGDEYVGEWKDDKANGHGIYTYADGRVQGGIWTNGKFRYARRAAPTTVSKKSPLLKRESATNSSTVISASSGSGFAVSSLGHIITNNHVVDGCEKVKIHHKGKSFAATVVANDLKNDIALLKGDFNPSTVLRLSQSRPELLQDVYVAGYPFGQKVSASVKVTKGIISSLTGIGNNFSSFQIDAALQPGNSGGPILDDKGNVVGVADAKLDITRTLENFGVIPEDTNFGIKTKVVRDILDSSSITLPSPNDSLISRSELGETISNGTYYLSCWMTTAQIEKMKSKKVMFHNQPIVDDN